MSGVLVRGGLVVTGDGPIESDLLMVDGHVAAVGGGLDPGASRVIEATGCWVGPAFVDLHTHLREPGQTWKEDISTGQSAALHGGYGRVYAMPNTDPAIDSPELARRVARSEPVRVLPAGAITRHRRGEVLADLEAMWEAGVRLFTDDGDSVVSTDLLRRAMTLVSRLDRRGEGRVVLAQHAEHPELCRGGHLHLGSVSERLGITGLPAAGEEVVVGRDLALVEETGCRYHVQHVSTAGTVELVRSAKRAGLPVTAEVTPHHVSFDHNAALGLDPVFKMYPPLRTPDDVAAVREALVDGTIDAVATDHAPHTEDEKAVPFVDAPRGVIGLETAAAAINTVCDLDPVRFFARMAVGPQAVMGEECALKVGSSCDVVVFDPTSRWIVKRFASKSTNSPWMGSELTGRVKAVVTAAASVEFTDESVRA